MMNLLATIVGLIVSTTAFADFTVPPTNHPVNDYANVLTSSGKERIAKAVVTLKQETGAQVGVLIVESLDGSSVEEASMAAAKQWGLGSKEKDDGALLFIAVKDRKFRLEVGRGLEGVLTDYHSRQITASMRPYLKSKDFDGAVLTGITAISDRIKAHAQEITAKPTSTSDDTDYLGMFIAIFASLGLIGFFFHMVQKKREEDRRRILEAQRFSRARSTPYQAGVAREMYKDVKKRAAKEPAFEKEETKKSRSDDSDGGFASGVVVGSLLSSSSDDDDSGSGGSFGGGSDFGGSDFGGGGGDFGGGGSSDSF